jgi:hypothetical protein
MTMSFLMRLLVDAQSSIDDWSDYILGGMDSGGSTHRAITEEKAHRKDMFERIETTIDVLTCGTIRDAQHEIIDNAPEYYQLWLSGVIEDANDDTANTPEKIADCERIHRIVDGLNKLERGTDV